MPTAYCRYIKVDGCRCKSFAIHGESLCYFHRAANQRRRVPAAPEPVMIHPLNADRGLQREPMAASTTASPFVLDFPVLEDRQSIQMALSMLLSALGRNLLDPKRAGVMLYNLQVASSNVRSITFSDQDYTVRETLAGPDGTELAPDEDPEDLPQVIYV